MNPNELVVRNWRIVFFIWFVLLTVATHLPQPVPTDSPTFEFPDKLLHFISFGMLALFLNGTRWFKNPWACWLVVAGWAVLDEVTQDLLPLNRPFSFEDLLAGEMGIASLMLWSGGLKKDSTKKINEAVNSILVKLHNWFLLGGVGCIVTVVLSASIWISLKEITGRQYSSLAFVIAFITGLLCVLIIVIYKGSLKVESRSLLKSMVPSMIGTIVLAGMVGFFTSFTPFNIAVAILATLVIGSRFAWNRAI